MMLFMLCLFCSRFSACLHFQPQSVCNQCNKFRIGRLALMVIDCVAEQRINRIHLPENLVKSILLLIYQYIFLIVLL